MLDLKNITDEEFSILVTPSAPQAAMYREPSTGQKDQIQIAEHSTHKPKKAHRSVPTQ